MTKTLIYSCIAGRVVGRFVGQRCHRNNNPIILPKNVFFSTPVIMRLFTEIYRKTHDSGRRKEIGLEVEFVDSWYDNM